MTQAGFEMLAPAGRSTRAARVRLATLADADSLDRLFLEARTDESAGEPQMPEWLEHGGALLVEDPEGRTLSAVRWCEAETGWLLDRVATVPEASELGFDRWLMTKVEAMAIRYNVPWLWLNLPDDEFLDYYRRLGYSLDETSSTPGATVCKRVGGTWQMQERREE